MVFGLIDIIVNNNRDNRAALWAAYYVGLEVLLRMTHGSFVWEIGKYGTILLLFAGLVTQYVKKPFPVVFVLYFILLLPSLTIVSFPDFGKGREEISFNLSGPFLLALSAIYFFKRKVSGLELIRIFRSAIIPMISMLVYLFVTTPGLSEIEYGTESNFQASGGFGPNQVSTAIGLAIFMIAFGIFFKAYVINSLVIDIIFLLLFIVRGLATFSRGGVVGALIGIIILIGYTVITSKRQSTLVIGLSFLLLIASSGLVVWNYVNEQTKGKLEFRYAGKNFRTGREEDITSGRKNIMAHELSNFYQNPLLGIGPGMGTLRIIGARGYQAHSHSEYTRLLSEHGMFGLAALLIMVVVPLFYIFRLPLVNHPIPLSILFLCLFILSHSAMRLAIPSFFYGLALVIIVNESSVKYERRKGQKE